MNRNTFKLWHDKEKKRLDPHLFSTVAENFAKQIGTEAKNKKNKQSQLRRYYDEIVRLNDLAQNLDDKEKMQYEILPQVHLLISKIVYAEARELLTGSFVKMMRNGINQIEDADDLKVFKNFLESFIGFYKAYGPKS